MKEPTSQRLKAAEQWLRKRPESYPHELDFDVEAGLARHRAMVRQGVALPDWGARLRAPNTKRWLGLKFGAFGLLAGIGLLSWWSLPTAGTGGYQAKPAAAPSLAAAPESTTFRSRAPGRASTLNPTIEPLALGDSHGAPSSARVPEDPRGSAQPLGGPVHTKPPAHGPSSPKRPPEFTPGVRSRAPQPVVPAGSRTAPAQARAPRTDNAPDALRAGDTQEPFDAVEMQQVARAERLLESDPSAALTLVRAGEQHFRGGYFSQERRYLEVMSLVELKRFAEARAQGWAFLRDYRSGPYSRKLERVLSGLPE